MTVKMTRKVGTQGSDSQPGLVLLHRGHLVRCLQTFSVVTPDLNCCWVPEKQMSGVLSNKLQGMVPIQRSQSANSVKVENLFGGAGRLTHSCLIKAYKTAICKHLI